MVSERKIDYYSVIFISTAALIWILLWYTGGFSYDKDTKVGGGIYLIYYGMFLILFLNAYFSDDKTSSYEKEKQIEEEVASDIQVIAASTLGVSLFVEMSLKHNSEEHIHEGFKFLRYAFVISFGALIFVSVPKKNTWIRFYRRIKQTLLNFSIGYLLMSVIFITTHIKKK